MRAILKQLGAVLAILAVLINGAVAGAHLPSAAPSFDPVPFGGTFAICHAGSVSDGQAPSPAGKALLAVCPLCVMALAGAILVPSALELPVDLAPVVRVRYGTVRDGLSGMAVPVPQARGPPRSV